MANDPMRVKLEQLDALSGEAENDPAKFGRLLNTTMRAGAAAGGDTQQTEATIDAQEEQDLMKELESQLYGCEMDISSQDAQPTQYDLPPADLQTEGTKDGFDATLEHLMREVGLEEREDDAITKSPKRELENDFARVAKELEDETMLAKEHGEAEKVSRMAKEREETEKARLAKEKEEAEKVSKMIKQMEEAEKARLAKEREEAEKAIRMAKEMEQAKLAKEREETEKARMAKEMEEAKLAKEREEAEKARMAKEREAAEKTIRMAKELEEAKLAKEREETEKARMAKEMEEAKLAKEREETEKARMAKEMEEAKLAKEREEAEKARLAKEMEEAKLAKEREEAEKARMAKEREEAENARLAKEREQFRLARLAKDKEEAEQMRSAKDKSDRETVRLAKEKEDADKAKVEAVRLVRTKVDMATQAAKKYQALPMNATKLQKLQLLQDIMATATGDEGCKQFCKDELAKLIKPKAATPAPAPTSDADPPAPTTTGADPPAPTTRGADPPAATTRGADPPAPTTRGAVPPAPNAPTFDDVSAKMGWSSPATPRMVEAPGTPSPATPGSAITTPGSAKTTPGSASDALAQGSAPLYSRKSAAMFLNRLKGNPKRMQALPDDLAKLVRDEDSKSKAIDLIVAAGGDENELVGQWTASSISVAADKEKGKMKPLTEQELIGKYGAVNAAKVMEEKRKAGLEVDDPNCKGLKLYLHNEWQREWTRGTEERSSFTASGEVRAGDAANVAQILSVPRRALTGPGQDDDETMDTEEDPKPLPNKKTRKSRKNEASGKGNDEDDQPEPEAPRVEKLTPLDKAADLRGRALSKANHAGSMRKQLKGVSYATECLKEMTNFEQEFQAIYDQVDKLISELVHDDGVYLPIATRYLDIAKRYERPSKVANSLIRAAKATPKDPTTADDFDSAGAALLAQRMGAGAIPVAETSRIASAFRRDGASGLALSQMASSERERDFFRWVKLPIQPLLVDLPVWSNTKERKDKQLIFEKTAFCLPSDVLCELCKRSLVETCLIGHSHLGPSVDEWWKQERDQVYIREISRNNPNYQDMLPLRFHEDGVPTTKSETCNFWSWTTPLASRGSEISRFCPSEIFD
ncbi:unnamed protein product [Symbiodinium sp. CCMP2592]|nr:unnamed protein product [Symbiodinium sp. CCMP2592]